MRHTNTHLICVVGCGAGAIDTMCCHDGAQVISLHQQLELLTATLIINVDHSTGNLRDALYNNLHTHRCVVTHLYQMMTITRAHLGIC